MRALARAPIRALALLPLLAALGAAVPAGRDGADAAAPRDSASAALRAAVAASRAGEVEEALRLYAVVSKRHTVVADYADLLGTRLLVENDRPGEAAGLLLQALARHEDSPLRSDLHALLGDARAEFHDEEAARSAWRAAYDGTRDAERRGALLARLARSLERSAQHESAAASWLELWVTLPTHESAPLAGKRLDSHDKRLDRPIRSAEDWRRRGDALFRKRANRRALASYDRALELGLEGAEERRARSKRAHTLFRLRRYDEAVSGFASLPPEDDARLWHARSLARSGDVPEAVRSFEKLAKEARGEIGLRARFLAALLMEGHAQEGQARRYFEQVAAAKGQPGMARAALWRLGWQAYRGGDDSRAIDFLGRLQKRETDEIGRLRARYWRARAQQRTGDPAGRGELAVLANDFPLSYYGWRAGARVERKAGEGEPRPIRRGRAVLSPADLARPRILLEAGLAEEAREELRHVEMRARGLQDRLEMAQLFTDAGDYNRAQRVIVDAYQEPLARGPQVGFEELWWFAWPAAYADLVHPAASAADDLDPQLVFSIMREESGYRPAVVSVSGARGLLQIMETTGSQLARDMGRPGFRVDDLFEPATNIDLGAFYLSKLSSRFPGHLSAAIASYNAGPDAVGRWVQRRDGAEDDEWVEAIPYDQTRSYVKRVMRSLHAYRVLY